MAQPYMKEVMESMGWTDGSFIPIANAENRKLMEHINKLVKDKADRAADLQAVDERFGKLISHHKNAEQDIDQNLKLISAHRSQYTSENHMMKVAEREASKVKQLYKECERESEELRKYEENVEKEIKRFVKNIEDLSGKIEWAKAALNEWRQAMAKGEETNKMIEKFCKEDQTKAMELDAKRRVTQDAINKQKKSLIDLYEEQKTIEQALDRTAQLYRQAHQERQQMINTWKDAVNQMNQRERDIEQCEKMTESLRAECLKKSRELKDETDKLDQIEQENKDIEENIEEINKETAITKSYYDRLVEMVLLKEQEVNIAQRDLEALSLSVQQQRQRNLQNTQAKAKKEEQLAALETTCVKLKERCEKIRNNKMNAEERLAQLEELIKAEEAAQKQLQTEIERLNGICFRSQQQLLKMKDEEKLLSMQNKGLATQIQHSKHNIKETTRHYQAQLEIDYEMAFQIEMMEMKIDKAEGKYEEPDTEKQEQFESLEKEASNATKKAAMLRQQIVKVEEDMQKLCLIINNDSREIEKANYKLKEAQLFCEGGEKLYKTTIQKNQERIVELSLLKMKMNEMDNQIARHDDKSYTLEKHRMELEKTINERFIDIQTQLDLLFMKRKHLQEERGALRADLGERQIKIDALKKRYELAVELLGKNEDGSVVTSTQLKIEAAQEKQLLLEEGNELNEKVIKAENDIKAMENTLCLLNFSNDSYKKTFEKLDDENPEIKELENYQQNYCGFLTKLKAVKGNINNRIQALDESIQRKQTLEKDLEEYNRVRMDHKDILMKIYKELVEQKTKLQRADRELKLAQKAVKQKCLSHDYVKLFDRDLDLKEMEEKNTTALQLLADLVDMNLELAPEVSRLLYEKGLKIPQVKRIKNQPTWRSDYSDVSSCEGMKLFPSSSKASLNSMSSSRSSSSMGSSIQGKGASSATASVVSIDFPERGARKKTVPKSK